MYLLMGVWDCYGDQEQGAILASDNRVKLETIVEILFREKVKKNSYIHDIKAGYFPDDNLLLLSELESEMKELYNTNLNEYDWYIEEVKYIN